MKKTREMKVSFLLLCAIVFLLCAGGEAFAATYYVSPAGSDSSSGSVSAPFKTIQKAADVVNAGDTVIVKKGTYTDTDGDDTIVSLNRGGTSANWITFKSENKWGAVLDGQSNAADYCFIFGVNVNYVKVDGFEMKGCNSGGIWANGSNHDLNIYGNYFHEIGHVADSSAMGNAGVFIGRNTYNITVDSNLFRTIGRLNPNTTPAASESTCTTSTGVNACYSNDHGIYSYGHDQTFINNVFYEIKSGWAMQIAGGNSPDGPNWDIINNTFYGANSQRDGHIVLWSANSVPTNVLIQNNISSNPRTGFIRSTSGSSTWQFKNNLVYGASLVSGATNYTQSGTITGQDPKFVNVTNKDFHLQSGSPAIDKGASIAGYDYDADEKPIVGAPDIGAYEYGSSTTSFPTTSTDSTAPSVPAGLTATAVSSSQINLAWKVSTDNAGVSGYKVYRGTSLIATTTTTSYANTGLAASTTYTYSVSAFDTTGNVSSQSVAASAKTTSTVSDTQAPSTPTNLKATAVSSSQVNLSWTASTDNVGVKGYKVYRGTTLIATTTTTSYANIGLAASTAYTYKVAAFDSAGNVSSQSVAASATTPSTSKYTISGTITDTSGKAVVGATVTLKKKGVTQKAATTASNGTYSFTLLNSGRYTVTFEKTGYDWQSTAGTQSLSSAVRATVGPNQVVNFRPAKSPLLK